MKIAKTNRRTKCANGTFKTCKVCQWPPILSLLPSRTTKNSALSSSLLLALAGSILSATSSCMRLSRCSSSQTSMCCSNCEAARQWPSWPMAASYPKTLECKNTSKKTQRSSVNPKYSKDAKQCLSSSATAKDSRRCAICASSSQRMDRPSLLASSNNQKRRWKRKLNT